MNDNDISLLKLIRLNASLLEADSFQDAAKLMVDELCKLLNAARVVLVSMRGYKCIISVSGGLQAADDNEFAAAMSEMRKHFKVNREMQIVTPDNISDKMVYTRRLLKTVEGIHVLWSPLKAKRLDKIRYALWIERIPNAELEMNTEWMEDEIKAFAFMLPFFANALSSSWSHPLLNKRYIALSVTAVFILLLFLPVSSRINAHIQIKPKSPYYVFAPFNGILTTLHVKPGEKIRSGDIIFSYDSRVLRKQRDEAVRAVVSAKAELMRLEGAAYTDNEALARIPAQEIEVERKQADADYLQKQLNLSDFRSKADGVVILDDPDSLIGSFLQTGQMIMRIADPNSTEIKIMTPISDAGLVSKDCEADIRLDSEPFKVRKAIIERIGYDVVLSDENIPSVAAYAVWKAKALGVQPGQRGTATVKGSKTFLGLQIFRKPLITLRSFLGI